MNRQLKRLLLWSAILPGTCLFILTLFWIPFFITSDLTDLLIVDSFLLGIAGYVGLWRNLLNEKSKRSYLNKIFLTAGIIGVITFFLITRTSIYLDFGLLVFLWPSIVSIIILTDLSTMSKELHA